MTEEHAIKFIIAGKDYYMHVDCWNKAQEVNINNLSDEQLKRDNETVSRVPLSTLPPDAVCSMPKCWKPINENDYHS